jgi:hypothetical protein
MVVQGRGAVSYERGTPVPGLLVQVRSQGAVSSKAFFPTVSLDIFLGYIRSGARESPTESLHQKRVQLFLNATGRDMQRPMTLGAIMSVGGTGSSLAAMIPPEEHTVSQLSRLEAC